MLSVSLGLSLCCKSSEIVSLNETLYFRDDSLPTRSDIIGITSPAGIIRHEFRLKKDRTQSVLQAAVRRNLIDDGGNEIRRYWFNNTDFVWDKRAIQKALTRPIRNWLT